MQEVFEKIIEKLSNIGWVFGEYYPDGTNISRVSKKSVPYDEVVEIVKQVAAEYNNGWIPCSERLPEDEQVVLTCKCNNIYILRYSAQTNHWYELNGNWWWTSNMVIAWQPLPEPYKKNGE